MVAWMQADPLVSMIQGSGTRGSPSGSKVSEMKEEERHQNHSLSNIHNDRSAACDTANDDDGNDTVVEGRLKAIKMSIKMPGNNCSQLAILLTRGAENEIEWK